MKLKNAEIPRHPCVFYIIYPISRWYSRCSLPHFLHHFHYHFALTGNDLLDAVVELEEGILAVDDEAGRTGLAHQDAALTKREGTIARLKHRTLHSMKGREMPPLVVLALFGTGLTGAGFTGTGLTGAGLTGARFTRTGFTRTGFTGTGQWSLIRRRRNFRLQTMQEQHLAMMERTLGYLHPILTRSQVATLTLHGIADALMVDETTLAV